MAKPSTVIKACLNSLFHNERRIADWYNDNMEVQVMVSPGDGDLVAGKTGVYCSSEVMYQWYNLRIPKNANATPIDNDIELRYPLERHVEAIGMTGWDWKKKCSVRVGFDFDAITGHAKGVGISDEQLLEIKNKLMNVPEALVLRSTGGAGLHLYLEFDPENLPQTSNHTEHAALAIACLKNLSHKVGFDFQAGLDVGGGNMWIFHQKMTKDNNGLSILKNNIDESGQKFFAKIPENWRLYIDVATRKRQKIRIEGVPDEEQDDVSDKAASQKTIQLDNVHKRIITDLQQEFSNFSTIWIPDHHLLQTHTSALKMYFDAREQTTDPIAGIFNTLSEGRDPSKPNCFCFPLENGAFRVVRFGKGAKEHDSWEMDKGGWTYTYYNKALDFSKAASSYNGLEDEKTGFTFISAEDAINAVKAMGHKIEIPAELQDRQVVLRPHKDGKIIVEIETIQTDKNSDIVGWLKKRGKWIKVFNINVKSDSDTGVDFEGIDSNVRAVISTNNSLSGWYIRHDQGMWMPMNKDDARSKLKAVGYGTEVEPLLGQILSKSWIQVNLPFREEYPGNRQWNLNAAQLKFDPATDFDTSNDNESMHPHWDLIFSHIGRELDDYLPDLPWAKRNGILTGKDYLMLWVACMIREPFEPLPYLYLYGPQNSGKSILHEGLSLLMTKGVIRADTALTNQSDFNGELAGAILCIIEEKNITKSGSSVYNKIKDWVTSPVISIHAKYKQVFQQRNSTHWIQCANKKDSCPIYSGDTRITMIYVPELDDGAEVPKQVLLTKLEEEAPYFLATILNLPLPDLEYRLRVPMVSTSNKDQMEESNKTSFESFLEDKCFYAPGSCVSFTEFCNTFLATLENADERSEWTRNRIYGALPNKYPIGYHTGNARYVGNIAFAPTEAQPFVFISKDKQLVKKTED